MRLVFRAQLLGRVENLRLSQLAIRLLNALHHFFQSQQAHAGMLVERVRARLLNIAHSREEGGRRDDPELEGTTWRDSVSRFSRFRSARISAAPCYRSSRSFSNALLMMCSSSAGKSGFSRTVDVGAASRMAFEDDRRTLASERQCARCPPASQHRWLHPNGKSHERAGRVPARPRSSQPVACPDRLSRPDFL
jgi:hypothetical protein